MDYNITYREKDKGIQFIISYKDDTGKWKQKSKQGFKKKGEAKAAADKVLDQLKEDSKIVLSTEYEGITFKQFVDMFIKHERLYKEPNTIIAYETAYKGFADLYDLTLMDIDYASIQSCVDKMVKKGNKARTITNYVTTLKTILNSAVKPYKIIKENPVQDIKIPENKEKDKIKALNKFEVDDILDRIKPQKDYMISLIAATCGLRLGEIIGLTWSNIDFYNATLTVEGQWKNLESGSYGIGSVKSSNSNRTVPISPKTLKALKQYKKDNPTDLLNRIFLDKQTNSTSVRLFYKYRRLGYEISIHDLRHTYATMLIANGVDFKTAAKLLGHTVEMTMKVYSHVTDDMMTKTTNTINMIF